MFKRNWSFCSLLVLLSIIFLFSGTAVAEESWLRSLKSSPQPGRVEIDQKTVEEDKELSERAVHMQHSSFVLDRSYIPRIKKGEGHILLQLTKPLNPIIEQRLADFDVELLEYIPSNTWKAKVPAGAVSEVKALDFVHAMGDIYPVDKFPKHALEGGLSSFSHNRDGTITVLVSFHRDITFDRFLEVLTELSGTTDQEDFITGQRVLLTIPQKRLQHLATHDEVSWVEDRPTPKMSGNIDAARVSNVDDVQAAPYNLDGSGVRIGQWESGVPQKEHPDLIGRVSVEDTNADVKEHATHVAGTMIGDGSGDSDATGMAPSATLYSYDNDPNDDDVLSEMSDAVSTYSIDLSNNSWYRITGWVWNYYGDEVWVWFGDAGFGAYTSDSQAWDQTVIDTDLVIVKLAGNDRVDVGDQPPLEGHYHFGDPVTKHYDLHPPDGGSLGYDCIVPISTAKNIITVGAVNDSGYMSSFSSWGPLDDGRIKPDLMANGVTIWSTCPTDSYCEKDGTSMSTPVVTGATALIIQAYSNEFTADPSPAMVKALLVGTAGELGNIGPDYSNGWGMLDVKAAVDLIGSGGTYLKTGLVSNGQTVEYPLSVSSTDKVLKVTTVWTDPAGTPGAAKALVNDIDLQLIDPSGVNHLPWTLSPSSPDLPATRGINSLDNVEQVLVNFPQKGIWTIKITGTSIQGSQSFAVVSYLLEEFPVNTYHFSAQNHPSVAPLSGGSFIVVWADAFQEGARGYGIFGQRFDDEGNPEGSEFHVNTYTDGNQDNPSIALLSDGSFVVIWESYGQDGSGEGIYGQMFDSGGDKVGSEFSVNTTTDYAQELPSVAALSSGGFVVVWETSSDIYCQRFDSAGNKEGGEFKASTYNVCHDPSVAGLSGGGFVAIWEAYAQDGSRGGIYGQLFNGYGNPVGGEFRVNTHTADNQWHPSVASLSGGGFVVMWSSDNQDGDGYGVYGQVFESGGSKVGSEFPVNTHTADDQEYPSVAALSTGGFVVTWESYGQDGNLEGIYGRTFDSTGSAVGGEFQVNTYIVNSQESPSVAGLSSGDFVVTWTSSGQDGGSQGIFGKRFVMEEPCEGDFNDDGDVDGSDLAIFAADFGRTNCDSGPPCEGDFNSDNDVDGSDLAVFAADFGRTDCP